LKTVCLLDGNIKDRRGLLEQIKGSLSDYEYRTFDDNDYYDEVSQIITELSCFGKRRLFILKALPKLKGAGTSKEARRKARDKIIRDFKKLFPVIPMGNLLIFDDVGISAKSFLTEVEKYGSVHVFEQDILEDKASKIISDYFKEYNIEIENTTSVLIASVLSKYSSKFKTKIVNVDKLSLLLLQLYHYIYGKTSITSKDVYAVCSISNNFMDWLLYKIFDGTDDADPDTKYIRSFKLAMDFLENKRYFHHEVTMLLEGMLRRYGLVMMAKSSVDIGTSKKDTAVEIANIKKLKREGSKLRIKMSPKDGKITQQYDDRTINAVMLTRYGKDVISSYTLDNLLSIYHAISKSLVWGVRS